MHICTNITNSGDTLLQDSLLSMRKLREEVDLEKSRALWDNAAGLEKDLEICIRAQNNAWVIARITHGKELYMVLEKANETLLYASDAFEKFNSRYCIIHVFQLNIVNLKNSIGLLITLIMQVLQRRFFFRLGRLVIYQNPEQHFFYLNPVR